MDRGTGFGRSGHAIPAPAPGPPFAPGSAINGLSLNGAGQIVLGNDFPGVAAILLNDREIPFANNVLHFTNSAGTPGALLFDPPQVRSQNAANTASSVVDPGQITIGNNNPVFPPNLVFGTAVGAQTMSIVNAAGSFNVDNFATNRFLRIDPTAHVFAIGDIDNANLGNVLFIDDGIFGDESLGYSSGGVLWLTAGPGANGFTIGDQALTTGVLLTGDNTNNRLRFQNAAGIYLDLTAGAVRNYKIGQVTGSNGTFMNIDDTNNRFEFHNTGLGFARFTPDGGTLQIFTPGSQGTLQVFNSTGSDGLFFDAFNRIIRSITGGASIQIGVAAGENVLIPQDLRVNGNVNANGTPGFTGTVTPVVSITVSNGIVTNVA